MVHTSDSVGCERYMRSALSTKDGSTSL